MKSLEQMRDEGRDEMGPPTDPQSYQYPNLSEGADRVAGQLRGDKECPFSGVTKSGRVWRRVPESDARSLAPPFTLVTHCQAFCTQGQSHAA